MTDTDTDALRADAARIRRYSSDPDDPRAKRLESAADELDRRRAAVTDVLQGSTDLLEIVKELAEAGSEIVEALLEGFPHVDIQAAHKRWTAVLARYRKEVGLLLPAKCAACGIYPADPPSSLCPGCEAYKEHTA